MTRKIISLYEQQFVDFNEAGLYPKDPLARERVLVRLEKLNESTSREIFQITRKGIRATSHVGVVQVGDFTFEVLPKIDTPGIPPANSDPHQSSRQSAVANLLAMLSYAFDLRLQGGASAGLREQQSTWIEQLTGIFAQNLLQETANGLPVGYITRQERLPVLRGKWDIHRQVTRQIQGQHNFEVIYDDLTVDIPLNQVFRYVIERLISVCQVENTSSLLRTLRERFSGVSLQPVPGSIALEQVSFHRLNERYQPAFNLARMFLQSSVIQLAAGRNVVPSFMLDMNILFERFITAFLQRHHAAIFPSSWQEAHIIRQSQGMPYYLARDEGKPVFRLRPDILVYPSGASIPALVIDTKYKSVRIPSHLQEIAKEDIYQMAAYSIGLKVPRGLLLYPQSAGGHAMRKHFTFEHDGTEIFAATVDLRVALEPPEHLVRELAEIFQWIDAISTTSQR